MNGKRAAVNPAATGTKAAARYSRTVDAGRDDHARLATCRRWSDDHPLESPFADFDALLMQRQEEADEFYNVVLPRPAFGGCQN